jgi:hypothetical protein
MTGYDGIRQAFLTAGRSRKLTASALILIRPAVKWPVF